MRPTRALAVLVAGLAAGVIARSTIVADDWHFVYNLGLGAFAVGVAASAGLRAADLGCARSTIGAGLRLGAVAFVAISATEVIGALAGFFDSRAEDLDGVTTGEMLLRVLVTIPLGTVLVEELTFRGSLEGLLRSTTTATRSMAAGAALFGLWHVAPIADEGVVTVLGTVAATTVAGVGLIWLRRRSASLVAPMLAHLATNSTAYALAWLVSR